MWKLAKMTPVHFRGCQINVRCVVSTRHVPFGRVSTAVTDGGFLREHFHRQEHHWPTRWPLIRPGTAISHHFIPTCDYFFSTFVLFPWHIAGAPNKLWLIRELELATTKFYKQKDLLRKEKNSYQDNRNKSVLTLHYL